MGEFDDQILKYIADSDGAVNRASIVAEIGSPLECCPECGQVENDDEVDHERARIRAAIHALVDADVLVETDPGWVALANGGDGR